MVCAFVSLKRIGVADWLRVKWDEVDGLISPMTRMISDNTSFIAVGMVIQYQAEQCCGGSFSFLWLARIMYHLRIDQTSDLA
jgi:hypothetical protein